MKNQELICRDLIIEFNRVYRNNSKERKELLLLLSELCVVGLILLTNTHFKVAKATCFQCIESWVVERVLGLPLVASTVLEIEKALPLKRG